jgi:uncharacterized membrane protein HdeD (DUF308 family)
MTIKNTRSNFTIFLSGICLIILAVLLFFRTFSTDLINYRFVGIVCELVGFLNILAFGQNKRWYFRPGWMLQQSFFLIFFGVMVLLAPYIHLDVNLTIFSFLAFFTAATQLSASIQLRALEINRWWWVACFGFINILFGVYFLVNPFEIYFDLFFSVAVFLLTTGLIYMIEPFVYIKNRKKVGNTN